MPNDKPGSRERELLPCPFCRSHNVKRWTYHQMNETHKPDFVQCADCASDGPYGLGEEADERWNHRAQPPAQAGSGRDDALEEAAEICDQVSGLYSDPCDYSDGAGRGAQECAERIRALIPSPAAAPAQPEQGPAAPAERQPSSADHLSDSLSREGRVNEGLIPSGSAQPEQGWVRVPREPTVEMIAASYEKERTVFGPTARGLKHSVIYETMLAALSDSTKDKA